MTITPIFGILIRKQMEIIMKATYSIIRHSVFETNSSSCHSLALTKGDNGKLSKLYTDYQLDENGNLHFNVGEYAWGFDILSDFQSKFDYVMTYTIRKGSHYEFLDLMKSLHDVTQFNELYYCDQLVAMKKKTDFNLQANIQTLMIWTVTLVTLILNQIHLIY